MKLAEMSSVIEMSTKSVEADKEPSMNWKYRYWLRAVTITTCVLIVLVWLLLPTVITIYIYSLSSVDLSLVSV